MADISPAHIHFKLNMYKEKKKVFAFNSSSSISVNDVTIVNFIQAKN